MAHRQQVFQEKVLQKLFPAPPTVEKVLNSPALDPETSAASKKLKIKPHKGDNNGRDGGIALTKRKFYTVLPPPKDYKPGVGYVDSAPTQPEPDSAEDGEADPPVMDDRDVTEVGDGVTKRRKRKKKRNTVSKIRPPTSSGAPETTECGEERNEKMAMQTFTERLSKNQKRKMKKKRHKEKLLSLGLLARPAALEFTYKQDNSGKEEDGEHSRKAAEVVEFLRKTRELYLSDRSRSAGSPGLIGSAPDWLVSAAAEGAAPPAAAVLALCSLSALLGRRDTELLNLELQEFQHTSTLPAEETNAIWTLFHYWINEVLPLQKKT